MISNNKLKEIIDDCKAKGHIINMRDISYVILCRTLDDYAVAYRVIYGNDNSFIPDFCDTYHNSNSIQFLISYIETVIDEISGKRKTKGAISFEENRGYMLKLKEETERAIETGEIDKKDGLVILKDIAVKLNDKFNVYESQVEQMVVVNKKYNAICPHCNHEMYIPTKKELMEKYNLVEKQ